jgi:hypothetical protein
MRFKKVLAVVGSVAVAGSILSACGETEVKQTNGSSDQAKQEQKKEDTVYKVGDTVSVNGVELTIDSADFTGANDYSPAENGKVLTLEVTAKNTTDSQQFVDNTEFAVYDKDGNKAGDYYGYDQLAISDNVNAGKQLQGKLYFDVPEQESYELIYTPSFSFDGKEVKFNIDVNQ